MGWDGMAMDQIHVRVPRTLERVSEALTKRCSKRVMCVVQIRLLSLICLKVNMEIQLAVLKKKLSSEKRGAPRRAQGKQATIGRRHANQQSWRKFLPLEKARHRDPRTAATSRSLLDQRARAGRGFAIGEPMPGRRREADRCAYVCCSGREKRTSCWVFSNLF